jgi:Ran GTPase-activating protein (RanGAP) involved in mRNA processing and transport
MGAAPFAKVCKETVDCATALNTLLDSTILRVLNFSENRVTNEGIEVLARGLHGNSSLRELNLQCCEIGDEGLLKLGEALVENLTLQILRLSDAFGQDGVSQFFQLLPQMEGLKELCLDHCVGMDNEDFYVALVDGLRKNTSLHRLTYQGGETTWHDEAPSHVKPLIAFYLDLNRNGRKLLEPPLALRAPIGLWPHILANMLSPEDTSLLYYFLRKKPTFGVE